MSMVAIFQTECCQREIVRGRFKGSDMYPPSLAHCPFGCADKFTPSGKPDRVSLKFLRYQSEESLAAALRETNPRLDIQSGNFWHKYNEAHLKAKAS